MGIAYALANDFKNLYREIFQLTEKWLKEIAKYMPADRKRLLRKKPHPLDIRSADTPIDQQLLE